LLFYISNDNVTLTECFYKLNSFYINLDKFMTQLAIDATVN